MDLAELHDFESGLYAQRGFPVFLVGSPKAVEVLSVAAVPVAVVRRASSPVARPESAVCEAKPSRSRVADRWARCLECECEVPDGHGRYRGMCPSCHAEAAPGRRRWYADMVERWRKLLAHRYREQAFGGGRPDPWQVTLYTLHRRMLGFGTSHGLEGTERAGLADRLGTSVAHLEKVMRGTESLSPTARAKLVESGAEIFAYWRDTEDEDDDAMEVA